MRTQSSNPQYPCKDLCLAASVPVTPALGRRRQEVQVQWQTLSQVWKEGGKGYSTTRSFVSVDTCICSHMCLYSRYTSMHKYFSHRNSGYNKDQLDICLSKNGTHSCPLNSYTNNSNNYQVIITLTSVVNFYFVAVM